MNTVLPLPMADELHVWSSRLDRDDDSVGNLYRILSADEQERAQRFRFERDRRRFIAAKGTLRQLLSLYLKQDPSRIQFLHNPFGKPDLELSAHSSGISFNMSHSHEVAVYVIADGCPVGIDVEFMDTSKADLSLAKNFFSPFEIRELMRLPAEDRPRAFLACWTRKEAYIKARGEGLSIPLNCFDVSLAPGEPAALLESRHESDNAAHWRLYDINLGRDYVAALAARGRSFDLCLRYWK